MHVTVCGRMNWGDGCKVKNSAQQEQRGWDWGRQKKFLIHVTALSSQHVRLNNWSWLCSQSQSLMLIWCIWYMVCHEIPMQTTGGANFVGVNGIFYIFLCAHTHTCRIFVPPSLWSLYLLPQYCSFLSRHLDTKGGILSWKVLIYSAHTHTLVTLFLTYNHAVILNRYKLQCVLYSRWDLRSNQSKLTHDD